MGINTPDTGAEAQKRGSLNTRNALLGLGALAALGASVGEAHAQQNLDDGVPAAKVDTRPAPKAYSPNLQDYMNALNQPDEAALTEALTKADPRTRALLRAQLKGVSADWADAGGNPDATTQVAGLLNTKAEAGASMFAKLSTPGSVTYQNVSVNGAPQQITPQSVTYHNVSFGNANHLTAQEIPVHSEIFTAAEALEALGADIKLWEASLIKIIDREITTERDPKKRLSDVAMVQAAIEAAVANYKGADTASFRTNLEKAMPGLFVYIPHVLDAHGRETVNATDYDAVEVVHVGGDTRVERGRYSDLGFAEARIMRDTGITGRDRKHTTGAFVAETVGDQVAIMPNKDVGLIHPGSVWLNNPALKVVADTFARTLPDGGKAYFVSKANAGAASSAGAKGEQMLSLSSGEFRPQVLQQTASLDGTANLGPVIAMPVIVHDVLFTQDVAKTSDGSGATAAAAGAPAGGGPGGGGGGGPGCFIATTKVILVDGSEKQISEIQIGDKLIGLDGSINEVLGLVTPKLGNRELFGFNDSPVFVTAGHPFRTKDGKWKSVDPAATLQEKAGMVVDKLEIGDTIVTQSGEVVITKIHSSASDAEQTLHDFNLSGNHTYYADGYAVHNK